MWEILCLELLPLKEDMKKESSSISEGVFFHYNFHRRHLFLTLNFFNECDPYRDSIIYIVHVSSKMEHLCPHLSAVSDLLVSVIPIGDK